jgi:hypothetical protein
MAEIETDGQLLKDAGIDPATLQGFKYLKQIQPLLAQLASSGTERDTAGNRQLTFSFYAGLILLRLFNPTLDSLRALSEASSLRKVQQALGGVGKASVGSLSESVRVFDPKLLEAIFQDLLAQVPPSTVYRASHQSIPLELVHKLTAVDGSALRALPQIIGAVGSVRGAKWRLHLQFKVCGELPRHATLTPDETGGEDDERSVLARNLITGLLYLLDRGYERYTLFNDIVAHGSDYVCRVQLRTLEVVETRPLSDAARQAGVISDEIVRLAKVGHAVRRVIIQGSGQGRRRTDKPNSHTIVLLTNLLEVPAEVIAALYQLRWSIELFFKFFKHVLGCKTLLSHKPQGVLIQVYCALIAALLMSLATGQQMNRRIYECVCLYFQGWAEEDELLACIQRETAKMQKQRQKQEQSKSA